MHCACVHFSVIYMYQYAIVLWATWPHARMQGLQIQIVVPVTKNTLLITLLSPLWSPFLGRSVVWKLLVVKKNRKVENLRASLKLVPVCNKRLTSLMMENAKRLGPYCRKYSVHIWETLQGCFLFWSDNVRKIEKIAEKQPAGKTRVAIFIWSAIHEIEIGAAWVFFLRSLRYMGKRPTHCDQSAGTIINSHSSVDFAMVWWQAVTMQRSQLPAAYKISHALCSDHIIST